jgi:hypothetical protein
MSIKSKWANEHPEVRKAAEKLNSIKAEEVAWVADPKQFRAAVKDHQRRTAEAQQEYDDLKERMEWEFVNATGENRKPQ